MAESEPLPPPRPDAPQKRGRQLGLVAVLSVAGAALAAVAAALTWWSADYLDPLTGPLTISLSGAACVPELIPLALVALAGFGAALATRGLPRRLVGLVLVLSGATIVVRTALTFGSAPTALVSTLTRPADPVGGADLHPFGPILAVLGGLLLAAAGVLIGLGMGARQRLGAKYDAPSKRAAKSASKSAPIAVAGDPTETVDPGDWWKALDAGGDPTVDAPAVSGQTAVFDQTAVSDQTSVGGYHDPNAGRGPG